MNRHIKPNDPRTIYIDNIEEMRHLIEILERVKMIETLFHAFADSEDDPDKKEAYAEVANNLGNSFKDYFDGVEFCDFPVHPPHELQDN